MAAWVRISERDQNYFPVDEKIEVRRFRFPSGAQNKMTIQNSLGSSCGV